LLTTVNAVLEPNTKALPSIELPKVSRYAWGQFEEGSCAIWALGDAGWYEIQPSRAYKSIYDNDIEAIFLYYFLKDAYQWSSAQCSTKRLFSMVRHISATWKTR
jgi:hypothetical protein